MQDQLRLILLSIIVSIVFLILVFLISATLRRLIKSWKYRKLDKLRDSYHDKLTKAIEKQEVFNSIQEFHSSPGSLKFQAIEHILLDLIQKDLYREDVKILCNKLGYVTYYEKKLKSMNNIVRATAIDTLGKMLSESSIDKIANILETKNTEIISVAVRALSKIGTLKALEILLHHLPKLYKESLIAQKTIETSLTAFGIDAIPVLIEHGKNYDDKKIKASILEVLSTLPITEKSCSFALDNIKNTNAEVRAKALKILGMAYTGFVEFDYSLLFPLLDDPVWFVRLQASKAFGNLKYKKAIDMLGGLLLDQNWQVRNAAALALTKFEDDSINIFLRALRYRDAYAKESVCEEIQKTNFVSRLIENLRSEKKEIYEKSREILSIMHSLNFSTPLNEYLSKGQDEKIKYELSLIMRKGITE
ncbi:MAG: HEAT repeat domain-containing protein [Nitrospirae bacterium]|nr:HEAT repeat domain-containing protein [Nitrospirota bacterium]